MEDTGDDAAVPLRRVSPTADRSLARTRPPPTGPIIRVDSPLVTVGQNCARDAARSDAKLRINHINPRSFA